MSLNLENWRFWMQDVISPDNYINWGFYGIIAASLQRRVWCGEDERPLFPNLYIVLVGEPGVGKGRTLSEVSKVLRYHKYVNMDIMAKVKSTPGTEDIIDPLLIPVGADATTYEALVKCMSLSVRRGYAPNPKDPTLKKSYMHSSLAFCLEEISSLFRKKMESLANFLLVTYDCGDYTYDTVGRGEDCIRKCCLNMIAGTTHGFMKTVFGDELLTDGFASRTVFVCESHSRFRRIRPSTFTDEQYKAHQKILDHVKLLSQLYGQVTFTEEALLWLDKWWTNELQTRVNKSPKLIPYYARGDITMKKLAMVKHFMDDTSMTVGLEECLWARKELDKVEIKMHSAVTLNNTNPLSKIATEIITFIELNGPQKQNDLLVQFWGDLPNPQLQSLESTVTYLIQSSQLVVEDSKYTLNGKH